MLGAVAGGAYKSLHGAMKAMSRLGSLTQATSPEMTRFHAAKREVYAMLHRLDQDSRRAMAALDACC
jgi:D-ribulokinase